MSLNRVALLGRLGQDPELKYTPSGSPVCNFSMATSETWKDKTNGEKQEKTEWHRIIVWGKMAELCNQILKKGSQVYIEGKLQTRKWEDKNQIERYTTQIVTTNIQFIGSGDKSNRPPEPPMPDEPGGGNERTKEEVVYDEDIPF